MAAVVSRARTRTRHKPFIRPRLHMISYVRPKRQMGPSAEMDDSGESLPGNITSSTALRCSQTERPARTDVVRRPIAPVGPLPNLLRIKRDRTGCRQYKHHHSIRGYEICNDTAMDKGNK